jgi:hypothetical protein
MLISRLPTYKWIRTPVHEIVIITTDVENAPPIQQSIENQLSYL